MTRRVILKEKSGIRAVTQAKFGCWITPSPTRTAGDAVSLVAKGPKSGIIGTDCHALWKVAIDRIKIYCLTGSIGGIGTKRIAGAI